MLSCGPARSARVMSCCSSSLLTTKHKATLAVAFFLNYTEDMNTLFNINDVHAGVMRSGGTTPATSLELRNQTIAGLKALLARCTEGSLIINGDLLDTSSVPYYDLWAVVEALSGWLSSRSDSKLFNVLGNHDHSKNTSNLSSFALLSLVLESLHPDRVVTIDKTTYLPDYNAWVIPHLQNQDLFDADLAAIPECDLLFVHVNFDNKFAVNSDHSLNMTVQQARDCKAKKIIFGHEHQARTMLGGKVVIVGNQLVTSCADCLGNVEKFMLKIVDGVIEKIPVWKAEGDFAELDWKELKDTGARFIRVTGIASAEESSDAVNAISRFRSTSKALVITNAVNVGSALNAEELALNAETVTAFNVKEALFAILDAEEVAVVKQLLGE